MASENWGFQVSIRELRAVTNLLLDHLEDVVGSEVTLSEDYYWYIQTDQVYNAAEDPDPSKFSMGQLTFDWDDLRKFLDAENYGPMSYGFVWLACIMRAIGDHSP